MKVHKFLNYSIVFLLGFLLAFLIVPSPVFQGQVIKEVNFAGSQSITKASTNIVAVSSQDNQGVLGKVTVELTPGDGKILVNTNPFLEPDIQYSATVAAEVAQRIAINHISDQNIIYNFDVAGNVLGGPSAGAAMTMTTISALLGKDIRNDVVVTGTIHPDGVIGPVSGLLEKAEAVSLANKKIFLVPKSQTILTYYEKEKRKTTKDGFAVYRTYYVPKTFDLKEYADQELNLEIREVETIYDVMKIMLKE